MSQTEAGTVRLRTISACDECRLRKSKCSGEQPRCHRCHQRRLPCVYSSDRRRLLRPGPALDSQLPNSTVLVADAAPQPSTCLQQPELASQLATPAAVEMGSPHIAAQKRFLSRDVLAQHIDAYYTYVYHVPGYNVFHRPSMLEDLHNDRIPPILCTALCAAVSIYMSRSEESRRLSVHWARDVDTYIFSKMNNLEILNLQLMILSIFQNFAYRQFGRVWLMLGMASRLLLSMQLNKEGSATAGGGSDIASRECRRRLAWSLFLQDKLHSGGVEEFLTLPEQWMSISLPMCEKDFHEEHDGRVGTLSDDYRTLCSNGMGINGFMMVLMNLRYHILRLVGFLFVRALKIDGLTSSSRETKAVIAINSAVPAPEFEKRLAPLVALREQLDRFYASLPGHLKLAARNIFSHRATSELTAYESLHTYYFQSCCDLFRICLPGLSRESASPSLLANAPKSFVEHWRCMAVSYARAMATNWQCLLDMKRSGALVLPGGLLPLTPAGCVTVHQCTKILLVARRYQLYTDLVDPVSNTPVSLDDQLVEKFCRSNVTYLSDLASVAPMAAVVLRDVRSMVEKEYRHTPGGTAETERPPVTSRIQQEKILSRYHVLAMGIAASSRPQGEGNPLSPPLSSTSVSHANSTVLTGLGHRPDAAVSVEISEAPQRTDCFPGQADSSISPLWQQRELDQVGMGLAEFDDENPIVLGTGGPPPYGVAPDYALTASQFDMSGELDWFLMRGLSEGQDRV